MREKLQHLLAKRNMLREQVARETALLAELEQKHTDAQEAQRIIQLVAETVQRTAHSQVASVVSRCLKAVFGDDAYEFQIDFVKRRGKTETEFKLVRDGQALDPLDATGGGVCDVVAFALRVAALVLTRPLRRQLLVLDEPFRNLSEEYRSRTAYLLEELSEELGIQMLIVTHWDEFQVGNVVRL